MNTNYKKPEEKGQHELSANVHEKPSTRSTPTETVMARLTSAKARMLHTSRLYLKVEPTDTVCVSKVRPRTVRSNATAITSW